MEYQHSVDKELKGSEMSLTPELQWSIPCMVDGLNRGQQKILFSLFKKNRAKPYKVSELAGYSVEQAAYINGQKSAEGWIISMAQSFVGSNNNINLLEDVDGPFRKYRTAEEILEEFFDLRLEYCAKRKTAQLEPLDLALLKVTNKVRFILGVRNGDIKIGMKRADFARELHKQGFDPFPKNAASYESRKDRVTARDYEYLLSIQICDMLEEKVRGLCAEKRELEEKVEEVRRVTPGSLWMRDLDALEAELDRLDAASRAEAEARAKAMSDRLSKRVTKRKKAAKKASANNGDGGVRKEGNGRGRKPAAKKPPPEATTTGAVATRKPEAAGAGVEGEAKDSKAEKVSEVSLKPAAAEEEKASGVVSPVKKVRRTRGQAMASTGDSVAVAAAPEARVTRGMKKAQEFLNRFLSKPVSWSSYQITLRVPKQ